MKTQHDLEKEQQTLPLPLPPLPRSQRENEYSGSPFPQPLKRPPRPRDTRWWSISLGIVTLILLLSIGTVLGAMLTLRPTNQVAPTPTPPGNQATQVPTEPANQVTPTPQKAEQTPLPMPGIVLGPRPCPPGTGDLARWDALLGTNNGEKHVESLTCANIIGNDSIQALVQVRHRGADAILDLYVFTNITRDKPDQLFKLTGLVKGNAKISGYNTVLAAEVDKNSSENLGKPLQAMVADLFREFNWSLGKQTLVQTSFPGLFPDLTRYQAEADQARVDRGQDRWKNDPVKVALAFEAKFIGWQRDVKATILSGGGVRDVSATVLVQETAIQQAQITVQLSRLEGNVHNLWVVTAVEDGALLTLTNIGARSQISSSVILEGKGSAFEGVIGQAVIYDHLYTNIGHAKVMGLGAGMGKALYSTKVIYTSSWKFGMQEGIAAVYEKNGGLSDEAMTAVLVKVLLDPEQKVALGPLPCPDAVSDPNHWTPFVSIPPNPAVAEQVICGNLLGSPTLQALVIAREIVGGGPRFISAFVFDRITDAQPKLLFKVTHLLHGDASISQLSTLLIAQVDLNSPQNNGKPDVQMQADLFREFQWNGAKKTFIQVAFPGLYPDLTRYQAEQSQMRIYQGEDSWKNNPASVAQSLAVKFFDWKRAITTKVLSGGGAKDVDATVQVQEAPLQGTSLSPTIVVALSRLAGNTRNMWVAVGVKDGTTITLTNIGAHSQVSSPLTLEGKGAAFEAVIGRAVVYDHLYTDIGHTQIIGDDGMGIVNYSTKVIYTPTFREAAQEGIVAVYEAPGGLSNETSTGVMVKVLLDPQPKVALGALPCPDAVASPTYWNQFLPVPHDMIVAETVLCGNLMGQPTLQVIVQAWLIQQNNEPTVRSIFVFDKITDAHPKLLFKLEGLYNGGVQISRTSESLTHPMSTILTAEVDKHSSVNKGKPTDQLTTDLFREFRWSEKLSTFVQVSFPGLYPDLTRWQAETDQREVNHGQTGWKLNALQTTQHMVSDMLTGGRKESKATLVSGGGAKDTSAVVDVTFPTPETKGSIPVTRITLSRLGGNEKGIWEVESVSTNWLFIYTPKPGTTMKSPVTVAGLGPQFEAVIGVVFVEDHLYQQIQIGDNFAMAPDGASPPSEFSLAVKYTSSFEGGAQEGIVGLIHAGGPGFDYGVVLVKVLIGV